MERAKKTKQSRALSRVFGKSPVWVSKKEGLFQPWGTFFLRKADRKVLAKQE
jgi:hypothetical protein